MKNSRPAFQDESEANDAWAARLRQLGPAAPRPEMAEHDRVTFCAGFLAARAGR